MPNSTPVRVKVVDRRGLVYGEKYYKKGDTLDMDRNIFEILCRQVKVEKVKAKKTEGK